MGMSCQVAQSAADDHGGEKKIGGDDDHGQLHHPLPKAASKDGPKGEAEDREHNSDYHLPVPVSDDLLPEQLREELLDGAVGLTERIEGFLPHELRNEEEEIRSVSDRERFGDE